MKVTVTQEDIDRGTQSDCRACPIALAAIRLSKNPSSVTAGPTWIVIDDLQYSTPQKAYDFMCHFDDGEDVKPFSFTLKNGSPKFPRIKPYSL